MRLIPAFRLNWLWFGKRRAVDDTPPNLKVVEQEVISVGQLEENKDRLGRFRKHYDHIKRVTKLVIGISDHDSKERDEALLIVRRYTTLSIFGGLIPIPYLDIAALTALQIRMLAQISDVYGVEFTKSNGKIAISSLMLAVPQGLSQGAFQGFMLALPATKFIPGAGTLAGEAAMASFGATVTYALGVVFIDNFESGGTLLDFDAQAALAIFEREIGVAKEKVGAVGLSLKERFDRMRKFKAKPSKTIF